MRVPPHEATTAQLGALYPFVASPPLPGSGVLIGRDLCGGPFVYDPFELYRDGLLTNPNMVVLGQIGRGKSAFVKTYCFRHTAFGRRVVILDPKGEYAPLAEALGASSIHLEPDGAVRLNPLDLNGRDAASTRGLERLRLLSSVSAACLGRELTPAEHVALELALGECGSRSTIGSVVEHLLDPENHSARTLHCAVEDLRADGREVALELRRLVSGEFRGMFDGPTSSSLDLGGPVVVIDLSAVYRSRALGALITCATAAVEAARRATPGQTILVIDEAWAVLSNVGAARFLQASFKLARQHATANIAVLHRVSDLAAAGPEGSITAQIARGLLADCETVVCYSHHPGEVAGTTEELGLGETEAKLLCRMRRAVALWRVCGRPYLVEHRLSPAERRLVDTDGAMVGTLDHASPSRAHERPRAGT